MTERHGPSMDQHQVMLPEMQTQQVWEQSPLMESRSEVFRNMRREGTETDLDTDYKEIRDMLTKDRFVIVAVTGRQKAAKGGLLMGISDLLERDLILKQWGEKEKADVHIKPVLFAHSAYAAQLRSIRVVEPDVRPQDLTREHTTGISEFMTHTILSHALPRGAQTKEDITKKLKEQGKAVVVLVETTAPVSYPDPSMNPEDPNVEVKMIGEKDWGNSTFVKLAFDKRTKDNTIWYVVDKDDIKDDTDSTDFRAEVMSPNPDFKKIFGGSTRPVVTLPTGEEVEINDLPIEEQKRYVALLRVSMAPTQNVVRNDERIDKVKQVLHQQGIIENTTDAAYFEYYRKKMGVSKEKFRVIKNSKIPGRKAYSLNYLENSLVLEGHPDILADAIQSVIAPPKQDVPVEITEQPDSDLVSNIQRLLTTLKKKSFDSTDVYEEEFEAIDLINTSMTTINEWISNENNPQSATDATPVSYDFELPQGTTMSFGIDENNSSFVFSYSDTNQQSMIFTLTTDNQYSLFTYYSPDTKRPTVTITRGEEIFEVPAAPHSPAGHVDTMDLSDSEFVLHFLGDFIARFIENNPNGMSVDYGEVFEKHARLSTL